MSEVEFRDGVQKLVDQGFIWSSEEEESGNVLIKSIEQAEDYRLRQDHLPDDMGTRVCRRLNVEVSFHQGFWEAKMRLSSGFDLNDFKACRRYLNVKTVASPAMKTPDEALAEACKILRNELTGALDWLDRSISVEIEEQQDASGT